MSTSFAFINIPAGAIGAGGRVSVVTFTLVAAQIVGTLSSAAWVCQTLALVCVNASVAITVEMESLSAFTSK